MRDWANEDGSSVGSLLTVMEPEDDVAGADVDGERGGGVPSGISTSVPYN